MLSRFLEGELGRAEKRVQELIESGGAVTTRPWAGDEGDDGRGRRRRRRRSSERLARAVRRATSGAIDALPRARAWRACPACRRASRAALRHAALAPGKRLRPILVLLGYDAAGGSARLRRHARRRPRPRSSSCTRSRSSTTTCPRSTTTTCAAAGRRCTRAFDEATAILAGDALLALAFEDLARSAIARFRRARCARALRALACASGAAAMVGGQVLDLAAEGRWGRDARPARPRPAGRARHPARKDRRADGRLARRRRAPGGARPPAIRALEDIGHDLGLAFQIADDLLNEPGDARALGKNAGTDRARGKATWHAAARRSRRPSGRGAAARAGPAPGGTFFPAPGAVCYARRVPGRAPDLTAWVTDRSWRPVEGVRNRRR